jgi:hypothetical protein
MTDVRSAAGSTASPAAPAFADGEEVRTLREAARVFFSRPGPRRMAAYAATAWAGRAMMGGFGAADLAACTAVGLVWPLQEWLAHKFLLHLEPREGRVDPSFARCHRAHHEEPRDLDLTLLPADVLALRCRRTSPSGSWRWGPGAAHHGIAAYATMALVRMGTFPGAHGASARAPTSGGASQSPPCYRRRRTGWASRRWWWFQTRLRRKLRGVLAQRAISSARGASGSGS